MPASLFKSRPKSNLRLQWKALKAKYAKTIDPKKVEVGLGDALDKHQKQVDAILKLEAEALTEAAFAPVVASSAEIKRLALKVQPKINDNKDYTDFLLTLRQEATWWGKTAKDFKPTKKGYVDNWDEEALNKALFGMQKLEAAIMQLDDLLSQAGKKTKTYTPPIEVTRWLAAANAVRPVLAKAKLLGKNTTGNFKQLVVLLRDNRAVIYGPRTPGMRLAGIREQYQNLPTTTDWVTVEDVGRDAQDAATEIDHAIGSIR